MKMLLSKARKSFESLVIKSFALLNLISALESSAVILFGHSAIDTLNSQGIK